MLWCRSLSNCLRRKGESNAKQTTANRHRLLLPTTNNKARKKKAKRNSMRFSIQMVGWLAVTKCGSQFDEFFCCRFFRCFYCSDSVLLLLLSNKHLKPWNRRCTVCTFSFFIFSFIWRQSVLRNFVVLCFLSAAGVFFCSSFAEIEWKSYFVF